MNDSLTSLIGKFLLSQHCYQKVHQMYRVFSQDDMYLLKIWARKKLKKSKDDVIKQAKMQRMWSELK